jgi:hypothetical protein
MPVPRLYIYHPPETMAGYGHIVVWLAELQNMLDLNPHWDNCQVFRIPLTDQLGFDVASEVRRILTNPGPVIFIHKAQRALYKSLELRVQRLANVYSAEAATCPADILARCEEARLQFEGGEPRVSKREMIAFLLLAKLVRGGYWGGGAKAKDFLGRDNLANGGFPKDVSKGEILDAADVLLSAGLLRLKTGDGQPKFGLAVKSIIDPILSNKSFSGHDNLEKWFARGKERVSVRDLDYNG